VPSVKPYRWAPPATLKLSMAVASSLPGPISHPSVARAATTRSFSELIKEKQATVGTCHRCHETKQELKRRRDVLAFAPLAKATWGVAIRQSEEEALAPTRQLESRLFFLGIMLLAVTSFLLWFLTRAVVKPLRELTAATRRVAAGDFKGHAPQTAINWTTKCRLPI
jgi:nitrate/nitrite-specific signal transduction histidine kinase